MKHKNDINLACTTPVIVQHTLMQERLYNYAFPDKKRMSKAQKFTDIYGIISDWIRKSVAIRNNPIRFMINYRKQY